MNTSSDQPHVINPHAVYFMDDAQKAMRWKSSTARREHREGRLRVGKRAGRCYILGAWLLEWLRAGEIKRKRPAPMGAGAN